MFIRFESPVRDRSSRVNAGIFCTAYDCIGAVPRSDWCWTLAELRRELDWFNDRLNAPRVFFYRPGRQTERSGVCWFRDRATDHINHARYMAWLLAECGHPINLRRSDMPGTILWEDRHQVVALPQSPDRRREGSRAH